MSARTPPLAPRPASLALALAALSILGCGQETPTAAAPVPAGETAIEHANKHLDAGYVCPMHPQVVSAEPGECPICGMDLVPKAAEPAGSEPETAIEHAKKHLDAGYVCPMHPQVVSAEPGECPICGMDLVATQPEPDDSRGREIAAADRVTLSLPEGVVNRLGVRTAPVRRGQISRHIEGFGSFLGSASRGYRPANRASDPSQGDAAASASVVLAQVFERDAPLVHPGQTVEVRLPGLGTGVWSGTVTGLETQISPLTRTLQLRVAVDLGGLSVPAGMTALVRLQVDPRTDVLLVPREAVILTGGGARVILALDEGRFQPREVEAEDLGGEEILIRSGLAEGERVVISAQFLLDSEANLQAGLRRLTAERARAPAAQGAER